MNYTTTEEVWKDVIGFEGKYEVSNLGKVRNKKNLRVLKAQDHNGYERVYLNDGQKQRKLRVHRIVAKVFLNPPEHPKQTMINHKDSNRSNNNVDNLEWCTHRENVSHAIKKGTVKGNDNFEKCVRRDVEKDVKVIRYLYETTHLTQMELSEIFNISGNAVSSIINRKLHKQIEDL